MIKIREFTQRIKWNIISKYLNIKSNSKIIDIGAGDLYVSKLIQDTFNSKVTGVDVVDYGTNHVRKVIISTDNLPFRDKEFDYAIIIEVLHHIEYSKQGYMLNEAKRVAKEIIIIEDAPSILTTFIDRLNDIRMPIQLAFRKKNDWITFLKKFGTVRFIPVKMPFIYPLKYYLIKVKCN